MLDLLQNNCLLHWSTSVSTILMLCNIAGNHFLSVFSARPAFLNLLYHIKLFLLKPHFHIGNKKKLLSLRQVNKGWRWQRRLKKLKTDPQLVMNELAHFHNATFMFDCTTSENVYIKLVLKRYSRIGHSPPGPLE